MRRIAAIGAAALALVACGRKAEAPPAQAQATTAPAAATTTSGPPVDKAEIAPDTLWIELLGVWAPEGGCGDAQREWRIEANAFHLSEMHCSVRSLALSKAGVAASAGCTVEGFDDGATHVYDFARAKTGKLDIVQESNGARFEGLSLCPEAPGR